MKVRSLIVGILLGTSVVTANAAVPAKAQDGSCTVIGVHEPNSNIYDGPTFCGDISLSYLTVRGPAVLNQTTVTGTTDISGPLSTASARLKDVTLEAQGSAIDIVLKNGTAVSGNITFVGKPGIVYLESGSTISGFVNNGTIVKK
jgi:hypothetical protein